MNDTKYLKVTDSLGNEKSYEILGTFKLPETGKHYVIYTDNVKDEVGNLHVYAAIYYPKDNTKLDKVETEEEWQEIERMLKDIISN